MVRRFPKSIRNRCSHRFSCIRNRCKACEKIIEIGDSNTVRRGEPVIAIGNPLGLQFSGTVTQGIISATERIVPVDLDQDGHYDWQVEVLQTDAAINPGIVAVRL